MASDERGLTRLWRSGPVGFGGAADRGIDVSAVWSGLALRPRVPVHGRVTGYGDLVVDWIRAPRYGGDSWDTEPPLCEDYELYRVQVFDGDDLKRSVETDTLGWTYHLADQAADFPFGLGADARIEVAQKSQVYGFGPSLPLPIMAI